LSGNEWSVRISITVAYHPAATFVHQVARSRVETPGGRQFMQRTLIRFGLCAIAVLGLVFASVPAPAAAVGLIGSVQGHVTDAVTSLPITNACVWFGPVHIVRTDPLTNCVFTDSQGFYSHSWINGPVHDPADL